ncbi:MAG: AAA family ATPase [Treponema berlinense]|uniref:chromosome segregation SMC family protein n=1 Tax=Treponema berlinense TaxID=225004 RepID=UPI00235507DB|nr:AAA family ATPase [Treponema berlinense]MCI5540632.1 AAA family ATPase [Treponema berlinense]MDD5833622.1 AAA family ATPase [Treponema berlinense]MDY3708209.1 AAA family ATPase [Treponema berlinense]
MFLKCLDIFGFKSFADRTHIEFADGITALLGPNGCGKSNVVDAVKWVLAENKAKNLRADTMESVIFNGTETRPPLNIAEVTLTIANENGLLPLEDSEIALKRRLYRSGESEYYINNRQVGPTEIRRLFMDTGVGKAAYSVMEQGKIDQILSSKPEDRRYLFEEAAGISRSKAECAEAERELERTRQNLAQIEVALIENKRSYETLKVQSEKTIKYRQFKDDIFNCELDIQLLRLKDFTQDKARQETAKKELEEKRTAVQKEIEEIQAALFENNDKIKDLQTKMNSLQVELAKVQTEKTNKLQRAQEYNLQANQIKEKIGILEVKQNSIQEKIDTFNEEIDEREADLHSKNRQLDSVKQNIESFTQNITSSSAKITENDTLAAKSADEIEELNRQIADYQKQLGEITEDIVKELDAKLKDSGYSSNAAKSAKEEVENSLAKLKIFAEGRKNIFSDYASITGHSESENEKLIQDAIKAFEEISSISVNIEEAVSKYEKAMPDFIEDFTSPEGIITKKRGIDSKILDINSQIEKINERIASYKSENGELVKKINEYRETLNQLRVTEASMAQAIFGVKQNVEILRRSLVSEQNNLRQNQEEFEQEQRRRDELNEQIIDVQSELAAIEHRGQKCADEMSEINSEIVRCNSSVSGTQNKLDKKQEEQRKIQSQYEKLAMDLVTSDNDIRNIKQNFIDTHSRDLMEFEERMYKITTSSAVLREKLAKSREELKALGSVNLMAPEEFGEQKERYEKLQSSYDDTNKSLENLIRVSEEIKTKSTEMFLDTYNKIKKNFHNMFRRLFGGGRGELRLVDPQNVLTSGIDIYAEPPGKKLQNIALLSGGEKTMTAVALLFATYQVRPSPFCLLDEIDAALDDKNVSSFVTALRSFAKLSQYIVITHNKKTVMGASTMLGVTMQESGVSKVMTMRLDKEISAEPDESEKEFIEEDVPPEENVYIPPRPAKRIHNPDGTITDPEIEKFRAEAKEAARKSKAAKIAEDEKKSAEKAASDDKKSENQERAEEKQK